MERAETCENAGNKLACESMQVCCEESAGNEELGQEAVIYHAHASTTTFKLTFSC